MKNVIDCCLHHIFYGVEGTAISYQQYFSTKYASSPVYSQIYSKIVPGYKTIIASNMAAQGNPVVSYQFTMCWFQSVSSLYSYLGNVYPVSESWQCLLYIPISGAPSQYPYLVNV